MCHLPSKVHPLVKQVAVQVLQGCARSKGRGKERECLGLVRLPVHLAGLKAVHETQHVVEFPVLEVGGQARDENGAQLVGGRSACTEDPPRGWDAMGYEEV